MPQEEKPEETWGGESFQYIRTGNLKNYLIYFKKSSTTGQWSEP